MLRRIARGMTNMEIAADLGVPKPTLRSRLASIARKLGTSDRHQMVAVWEHSADEGTHT
ncbi:hypothetical protein GV794_19605 [Nocardia cyriacigeorgica]|uniref:HTH luxR-type domain-containing protein n=2 Tax=Nocardia cyriacigeorgica TaxID=135487 RepID=A0A6P1D5B5_9NOCA|nr:hypothetical protein [Nocardia cyriacigeorgica]NEW44739.1 hypothetical protein [Nocardia cyriacigeorgica]NEW50859.1 hypothetical protein [Nocardia cyriacigeorgica]NEW57845.1 hypothetical protein [Nocardia cyriacigeorgica]